MKVFVCVGASVILGLIALTIGLETGILDCSGQPCSAQVVTKHGGSDVLL